MKENLVMDGISTGVMTTEPTMYGIVHNDDGPAVIFSNGNMEWRQNEKLHRLDGPAIEEEDGSKKWYADGELHRLDGPAIERADGSREWYVDGEKVDILDVFGYLPSVPLTDEEQILFRLRF